MSYVDSLDRVAKALVCNAKGDGFAPHLRRYNRYLFLESKQSPERTDSTWFLHVALQELTVTCNVSGDNLLPGLTAIINTRQSSTRTHTLPRCKHNIRWLAPGLLTILLKSIVDTDTDIGQEKYRRYRY